MNKQSMKASPLLLKCLESQAKVNDQSTIINKNDINLKFKLETPSNSICNQSNNYSMYIDNNASINRPSRYHSLMYNTNEIIQENNNPLLETQSSPDIYHTLNAHDHEDMPEGGPTFRNYSDNPIQMNHVTNFVDEEYNSDRPLPLPPICFNFPKNNIDQEGKLLSLVEDKDDDFRPLPETPKDDILIFEKFLTSKNFFPKPHEYEAYRQQLLNNSMGKSNIYMEKKTNEANLDPKYKEFYKNNDIELMNDHPPVLPPRDFEDVKFAPTKENIVNGSEGFFMDNRYSHPIGRNNSISYKDSHIKTPSRYDSEANADYLKGNSANRSNLGSLIFKNIESTTQEDNNPKSNQNYNGNKIRTSMEYQPSKEDTVSKKLFDDQPKNVNNTTYDSIFMGDYDTISINNDNYPNFANKSNNQKKFDIPMLKIPGVEQTKKEEGDKPFKNNLKEANIYDQKQEIKSLRSSLTKSDKLSYNLLPGIGPFTREEDSKELDQSTSIDNQTTALISNNMKGLSNALSRLDLQKRNKANDSDHIPQNIQGSEYNTQLDDFLELEKYIHENEQKSVKSSKEIQINDIEQDNKDNPKPENMNSNSTKRQTHRSLNTANSMEERSVGDKSNSNLHMSRSITEASISLPTKPGNQTNRMQLPSNNHSSKFGESVNKPNDNQVAKDNQWPINFQIENFPVIDSDYIDRELPKPPDELDEMMNTLKKQISGRIRSDSGIKKLPSSKDQEELDISKNTYGEKPKNLNLETPIANELRNSMGIAQKKIDKINSIQQNFGSNQDSIIDNSELQSYQNNNSNYIRRKNSIKADDPTSRESTSLQGTIKKGADINASEPKDLSIHQNNNPDEQTNRSKSNRFFGMIPENQINQLHLVTPLQSKQFEENQTQMPNSVLQSETRDIQNPRNSKSSKNSSKNLGFEEQIPQINQSEREKEKEIDKLDHLPILQSNKHITKSNDSLILTPKQCNNQEEFVQPKDSLPTMQNPYMKENMMNSDTTRTNPSLDNIKDYFVGSKKINKDMNIYSFSGFNLVPPLIYDEENANNNNGNTTINNVVLTEEFIINRFNEFQDEITPYLSSIICTQDSLISNPNTKFTGKISTSSSSSLPIYDNLKDISIKIANPLDKTNRSPSKSSYIHILTKYLNDRYEKTYPLPINNPIPTDEYYIGYKHKTNQIYLIKIYKYLNSKDNSDNSNGLVDHKYTNNGLKTNYKNTNMSSNGQNHPNNIGLSSDGMKNLVLLELKLGDNTLSDLIKLQTKNKTKFSIQDLRCLFQDCLASLYYIQLKDIPLLSLHTEFIFFDKDNQTFYILPAQISSNNHENINYINLNDNNIDLSYKTTPIIGDTQYMSPKQIEALCEGNNMVVHKPYKSLLFSFGLILLEAYLLESIEGLNESKKDLYEKIVQNPLYLTSSLIGFDYIIHCQNIFEILLKWEEEDRNDFITLTFEFCTSFPLLKIIHFNNEHNIINQYKKSDSSSEYTIIYDTGNKYIGQIKNNMIRNGHGSFFDLNDNLIYKGIWENNIFKNGIYIYNEEYRYEGSWEIRSNLLLHHGKGILYYRDQILYEGDWCNHKYHGYGKLYYTNGNAKYEGEFKMNLQHGTGKSYYSNGSLMHVGYYKEGKIYGKSTLYWMNGNLKFDGEILIENYDVYMKGTYYEESDKGKRGCLYIGELYQEVFHGKGSYYDSNGVLISSGEWNYGKLINPSNQKQEMIKKSKAFSHAKHSSELLNELKGICEFTLFDFEDLGEFEIYIDPPPSSLPILNNSKDSKYLDDFNTNNSDNLMLDLCLLDDNQLEMAYDIISKNIYLKGINILKLTRLGRYSESLQYILDSYNLKNLQKLEIIKSTEFNDMICKLISEIHSLVNLKQLKILDSGNFTNEGLKSLFNCAFLSNLRYLKIKNPLEIKDKYMAKNLIQSLYITNLKHLSLTYCQLLPSSIKYLFNANDMFQKLETLNLSYNNIGNKGCKHIMESYGLFPKLTKLSLRRCSIEGRGLIYLSKSKNLSNIKWLKLSENDICNSGCEALCNSETFKNLEGLWLDNCNIGIHGIRVLSNSKNMSKLIKLHLSYNQDIINKSAEYLAESEHLSRLEELYLKGCAISIDGIKRIFTSSLLHNLKIVMLFGDEHGKITGEKLKREYGLKENITLL